MPPDLLRRSGGILSCVISHNKDQKQNPSSGNSGSLFLVVPGAKTYTAADEVGLDRQLGENLTKKALRQSN